MLPVRRHNPEVDGSNPSGATIDWRTIPVERVPLGRFVICLNGITPATLALPERDAPVLAMARGPVGDIWIYNGRHRVLRALLRGDQHVGARLLMVP